MRLNKMSGNPTGLAFCSAFAAVLAVLFLGPVGGALAAENKASSTKMQKANIDNIKPDEHGKISKQVATMDGVTAIKVTFNPGAKWSTDLKHYAGTELCDLPHVAYMISGAIEILMKDGTKETFRKGDIMMLPPGHDAWTVGNEPAVFIQMSHGDDYYADQVSNLKH